ncbi:MAG: hypothetical protein WC120_01140 [Parcubacteria group bacterium]
MKHIGMAVLAVSACLLFVGCFSSEASVESKQSFFDNFSFLTDGNDQIKSIEVVPGDENPYRINFLMNFKAAVEPIGFWGSENDKSENLSLDGIVFFGRHDSADNVFRAVLDMQVVGADKVPLKLYIGYDDETKKNYRVEEFIIRAGTPPTVWDIEKTGYFYDVPYGD